MEKFEMVFWTDELIYMRSALERQIDEYGVLWRKVFIEDDRHGKMIANVYLPGINAMQNALETIDNAMPPKIKGAF